MKDKKREEMPDILNDILGNKKPENNTAKKAKDHETSHNVETLQQQDVMTSQSHKGVKQTKKESEQPKVESPVINDIKPSYSHDVIPLQRNDVMPSKEKVVKTTLYLSQELFDQLDEVWLKLRKKGYSKNDIVELAIRKILDNFIKNGDFKIEQY